MQFFNSFCESARSVGLSLTLSDLSYFKCFFVFLNWSRLNRPLSFLFVCLKYPSSKHFFSTQSI